MELCRTAFAFVICLFVPVQGESCSCKGGCDNTTLVFPGSDGRIVDVAYRKPANISSIGENAGKACMAVNGKTGTEFMDNGKSNPNCIHTSTADNGFDDWWKVDLGRNYIVTNITIYNRNDFQRRMSGIHVEVDNQTCYAFPLMADNDTALLALHNKIDVTCTPPLTGRVVTLQKRGQGYNYSTGAHIINVCEVQVWGCRDGLYGAECDEQCGQCADSDTCSAVSGQCPNGCQAGWQGYDCTQECDDGKYGINCSSSCGHCKTGGVCHHINGTCPSGCGAGFDPSDPLCQRSCPNGTYGSECLLKCGNCLNNETCNATTGVCPGGCDPGWTKPNCTEVCPSGTFGDDCSLQCTNCSQNRCYNVDGECLEGCKAGYQWTPNNHFCNESCQSGRYGDNCSEPCGHCRGGDQCDPFTGTCASCETLFKPPLCKVCNGKMYGVNCDLNCSANCGGDGSCEQDSGICVGGCKAGYLPGDSGYCNETCTEGKYGKDCSQDCGNCKGACRHEDGHCEAGCVDGFKGNLCAICMGSKYGTNCERDCSENCGGDGSCEQDSGRCVGECAAGYLPGDSGFCNERQVSSAEPDVPLIAGVVVGVLVLIALCVVLAIILIRRRKNKSEAGSPHTKSSAEPVNGNRETALSFDPITDSEAPKSSKPSAAVKPMVAEKPSKGVNQEDSGHIYYNTADIAAHQQSTPALQAAPASAPTQGQGQAPASGPPTRPQSPVSTQQVADPADYDEESSGTEGGNVYNNDDEDVYASFQATQPKLDAVQKYLVDALASGKLKEEFATLESMPEGVPQEIGQLKKNFKKNRFAAILPYDRNLVVLRDGYSEGTATDFVNASYVSGYQLDKQFIAAQGPRDNTVGDLWRMIWQEQITHIVMLTNIQERGKPKCELYWPEEEGGVDTFGPVTVTTTHVQCRDDFFIRTFNVQRAGVSQKSAESREVTQYHYVSWPDHGAPTTTSLVTFWRYVHNRTKPADGAAVPPVLVHCSAGVGRTGTYIGLEIGVDMAVNEGHINVLDLVKRLREERCLMVQAVDQYLFLHKALLEAYTAHGTNVSVDEFDVIFTGHVTSDKPHPRVDKEFQTLQQMLTLTPAHRHDTASLEENVAKNRNPDILPSEEHLVYLTEHVSGRNQYINAVFMPTFRDHRGSIVTQLPLPSTLVDFWRLVYGNDVSAIVSLSSPNEEQEVKPFCQYWPITEGKSLTFGPYFVTLTSKTERRGSKVTSYSLILGKKGVKSARVVELLHYKGWTGKVGGSTSDILHLIDTLVTLQNTNTDRLVVQCSDGVGKSGLFCALCDIINRMTYDREVDVYMTVRHVQSVTPKALSSATQYRYCYEVVQNRVREMSVYANAPQR